MVQRHIRKSAIALDLNKVDGQTIHKKNSLLFSSFNDIKHMAKFLILRKKQVFNQHFHFYFFNMDISLNNSPSHTHFLKCIENNLIQGRMSQIFC